MCLAEAVFFMNDIVALYVGNLMLLIMPDLARSTNLMVLDVSNTTTAINECAAEMSTTCGSGYSSLEPPKCPINIVHVYNTLIVGKAAIRN